MDFLSFYGLYKSHLEKSYSDRAIRLMVLRKVLDGTLYDILEHPFCNTTQKTSLMGDNGHFVYGVAKIGMSERRPSVISTLCGTVVEDSVSFLFGEGRFPRIAFDDESTQEVMDELLGVTQFESAMSAVALDGSVGTGVLLIKVLNSQLYYESLQAEYLSPVFSQSDPNVLVKLTQKYRVHGHELTSQGYKLKRPQVDHWCMRVWDDKSELHYVPWAVDTDKKGFRPRIDPSRSLIHNLGFVPAIWIKNMTTSYGVDGKCTFSKGVTPNIQLDYQLSQCGRGLTYSQEPLLFYKNPDLMSNGKIKIGDGTVLVGGENSDAKMIEINGDGCMAALAYHDVLRKIVLENIHGNRSTPDKGSFAQSGKALEMLHHPLILLASRLRTTYGEIGVVHAVKMLLDIISKKEIICNGRVIKNKAINKSCCIKLQWPNWFDETPDDKHKTALTLAELKNSGLLSQETAVTSLADVYDIASPAEEIQKILIEQKAFAQEFAPQIKETISS